MDAEERLEHDITRLREAARPENVSAQLKPRKSGQSSNLAII
jgi:hypothetical protein